MSKLIESEVAIIGSGGIGGYIAGELVDAGRTVTMCVRTPFERLTIAAGGRTRDVTLPIVSDPAKVGPARWVLLTTKAQDTAGAKTWLDRLVGEDTVLVVVQNGIGHEARARPIAGRAAIVPAIIYCSVERTLPGQIVHHGSARLVVPKSELSRGLTTLFAGTAFTVEDSDDFVTVAWRKLLSNLAANAITALTLRRTEVFADAGIRELGAVLMAEAVQVAQAEGAHLTQADADTVLDGMGRHGANSGTSMLYDRLAGRPLESRFITGALVEAAERHHIPVPVNRTLLALLEAVSGQTLAKIG